MSYTIFDKLDTEEFETFEKLIRKMCNHSESDNAIAIVTNFASGELLVSDTPYDAIKSIIGMENILDEFSIISRREKRRVLSSLYNTVMFGMHEVDKADEDEIYSCIVINNDRKHDVITKDKKGKRYNITDVEIDKLIRHFISERL